MKQATRMIKDILKIKYPNNDFHLKYYKTKDEIELFDKLTILCENEIDVDEVISHIKKYVSGIVVYKAGQPVPPMDREVNRMISIATYNWVELAALEYIEVKTEL